MRRVALLAVLAACGEPSGPEIFRPPGSVDVRMDFCSTASGFSARGPMWFAYKNEGQPWVHIENLFRDAQLRFPATPKVSIAYGNGSGGSSQITVLNLTAAQVDEFRCAAPAGPFRMTTTVRFDGEATVHLRLGSGFGLATGTLPPVIFGAPSGDHDLVAVHDALGVGIPTRIIVRHGITTSNNGVIALLDFTSPEARSYDRVLVQSASSFGLARSEYLSARGTRMELGGSNDGDSAYIVPASLRAPGDLHVITFTDVHAGVTLFTDTPRDTALGQLPTLPTVTREIAATTPFRPGVRVPFQAEYPDAAEVEFLQFGNTFSATFRVLTTAGFLGATPAEWDLSVPDLAGSAVPTSWLPRAGETLLFEAKVHRAQTKFLFGSETRPPSGEVLAWATRAGQ